MSRNKCVVILISGGSLTVFVFCRNSKELQLHICVNCHSEVGIKEQR